MQRRSYAPAWAGSLLPTPVQTPRIPIWVGELAVVLQIEAEPDRARRGSLRIAHGKPANERPSALPSVPCPITRAADYLGAATEVPCGAPQRSRAPPSRTGGLATVSVRREGLPRQLLSRLRASSARVTGLPTKPRRSARLAWRGGDGDPGIARRGGCNRRRGFRKHTPAGRGSLARCRF
jgi:hypothetical protein